MIPESLPQDPLVSCWIITEGIAGTENQCLGIAQALNLAPKIIRINLRQPWKSLSPFLGFENKWTFTQELAPPWPDLVLAGGRKSIAAARYIKKRSGGKSFVVMVQDPRTNPAAFDLVIAPEHDTIRGGNVFITHAAPNRITPQILSLVKEQTPGFAELPQPRLAVLIGGTSKAYTMTDQAVDTLTSQLQALRKQGFGLMVTASRRTGEDNRQRMFKALGSLPGVYFWDGTGENPYFAFLAWADYILVTADSVSMLSEAGTTGKPVYMIPLEGGARRIDALHSNLMKAGVLRRFEGKIDLPWRYERLHDAQDAAAEIRRRMALRG